MSLLDIRAIVADGWEERQRRREAIRRAQRARKTERTGISAAAYSRAYRAAVYSGKGIQEQCVPEEREVRLWGRKP
jgi:hypothetical protein